MRRVVLIASLIVCTAAGAQQVYRCVGAQGALEYSDRQCSRIGFRQEVIDVTPNAVDAVHDRRLVLQQQREEAQREHAALYAAAFAPPPPDYRYDTQACRVARKNNWGRNRDPYAVAAACFGPRAELQAHAQRQAAARAELARRGAAPMAFGFADEGGAFGSSGSHRVRGHFRRDGTYVEPHRASNRDGIKSNNWSQKGNVNPYTGKRGSK